MITIFSIPKPFKGHIGIIQRNAIQSWSRLGPNCEIILFGDEEGTASTAAELGIKHVPDVERNEFGTPLLKNMFERAQLLASNDIICYVNADIILMNDFIKAVKRVALRKQKFLMVGQRWNLDIEKQIDFNKCWEDDLRKLVHENGVLFTVYGIDYFVFPRGQYDNFPPFAVGRPSWDNWMIYNAHLRGIPVIDATKVVLCVHQNHDYLHLKDINNRMGGGPEANMNMSLANDADHVYSLMDSNYTLTKHFAINNRLIDLSNKCKFVAYVAIKNLKNEI